MKTHIKFPINIARSQGAYALELLIGSENVPVKLLIDTGSSTLAFNTSDYSVDKDQNLTTSQIAQCVTYGKGGWAGPVMTSQVTYSDGTDQFVINDAYFSITYDVKDNNFLGLDGILGLAYHHLNKGYHLEEYYSANQNAQAATFPWTFSEKIEKNGLIPFKKFLCQYPEKDITPDFTAFEEQNIALNKFALLTHRSIVYVPKKNMSLAQKENEPLNQGYFIIGDVEQEKDLYSGITKDIKVVHDAYYNTHLLSVRVEGFDAFKAPELDVSHIHSFFSNAIIDSGSSYLMLEKNIYNYIINCFKSINPKLLSYIDAFKQSQLNKTNYSPKNLDLTEWPNLYFTFEGMNHKEEALCCPPDHYWQLHALEPDQAFFTLLNQIEKWPNQSVIGLPIISSYLCIFDRSDGNNGVIKFADKKGVLT